jgi:hypothetical protein
VVVVVILIIGLVVNRNRVAAENAAWASYTDVLTKDVTEDPTVLQDARRLADQYKQDPRLGPAVLSLKGSKLYELALDMTDPKQKDERIEQFKEARSVFNDLAQRYPKRAIVVGKAKMMQALIEESLIVLGEGDVEKVRGLYNELKESESGIYADQAEDRLTDLDERLVPLEIVEAPATAAAEETPAPAEESSASTSEGDASEAVEEPPASAPATTPAS